MASSRFAKVIERRFPLSGKNRNKESAKNKEQEVAQTVFDLNAQANLNFQISNLKF